MESPLEVQESLYGEDGPPMIFVPEASALHLETRAPPTPKRACAPKSGESKIPGDGKPENIRKKPMTEREIFTKAMQIRGSLSSQPIDGGGNSGQHPSPCQLPGDFPSDLSFRSLAAYSLLRTLSVQLRLSPFTPNVFLRALSLPAPNRLLGEIHVALLRILFVQKLKSMGYSYKAGGGGVGVTKKRQIDGIRWPLLAGDNLTYLDGHSWPLFYDDYCHLTADRLWASYHGPLDGDGDDGHDKQNFIDFRNIGVFVPPKGKEYKTKRHADEMTVPISISSGSKGDGHQGAKINFDERISDKIKIENTDEKNNDKQLPLHISSSAAENCAGITEEAAMLNSDDSDSEDEYQAGDEDDDDSWDKPKKKKRRRTPKKDVSSTAATETSSASKEQKNLPIPNDWSRVTSLETLVSTPVAITTQTVSTSQNLPSDPSWSRIASIERSFSSPEWSPSKQSLEIPTSEPLISSSLHEIQHSMPSASTSTPIQNNLTEKSLQEDQPSKSTQPKMETQLSKQMQQQQQQQKQQDDVGVKDRISKNDYGTTIANSPKTSKNADSTTMTDPARIRGGGIVDDVKFTVPSSIGSGRQSMGRPRGSRRALPMRNSSSTPETPSFPTHAQHISMLQQQQQYLFYQSQSHQNFGQSQGFSHQYSPPDIYPSGTPRQFEYQVAHKFESNQKLNIEIGTRTSYEIHSEEPDMPFIVPDDIAKIVNDVAGGSSTHKVDIEYVEDVDGDNDNSDSESAQLDSVFENKLEMERWVHFEPLKAMRSGLPYHRLPTKDKVCILEFLIDELLTVDAISAEFSKRRNKEHYHTSPYGILPKEHEYQNMENKDECEVCGEEGDLLCCDGSLSSYHSYCLGMKEGQDLPEGKWLGPECSLVDPCNYGSLRGGQKSSLDWFTLEEIVNPSNHEHQDNLPGSMVSPHFASTLTSNVSVVQNVYMMQNPTTQVDAVGNPSGGSFGDLQTKTNSQSNTTENLLKWKKRQLIIVHGFIFCRESAEGNATFNVLKLSKPHSALTKAEFEEFISQTDHTLLQAWPLAQIPLAKTNGSWKFPSVKEYFAREESINPFIYDNKYFSAPISSVMKVGAAYNMVKLMYLTFESECNKPNTSTLSEVLTQDFSFDSEISASLKARTVLFDPFEVLKGYMLKLEHTLRRSCMLSEFWESGQLKSKSEIWISRVRGAQSVRALSHLLLKLVNETHTKAFLGSWFHSHSTKSSDTESSLSERNYKALPNDWSEGKEKLRRKWEITPSKMILNLCSDLDNALMGFASKIRTDIFIPKQIIARKSKRELKKAASSLKLKKFKLNDERITPLTLDSANQEQNGTNQFKILQGHQPTSTAQESELISNQSNVGSGKVQANQLPRESARDPAVTKSLEVPEIKKEQYANPGQLTSLDSKPEATGTIFPIIGECIEKAAIESSQAKIPSSIVQEMGNQILHGPAFHTEQNGPLKVPRHPTENKIDQEMVSKPSETSEKVSKPREICEGKAESTNQITTSDSVEENKTTQIEPEKALNAQGMSEEQTETTKAITASDSAEGNVTAKTLASGSSKKRKRKKSIKPSPREPLTRRRTRHSDRLSSEYLVGNSTVTNVAELKESKEFDALEGMALQIENAKKEKIPGLEKLLKGQYAIQGIWPIAGRRIFPTVGNIPPRGKFIAFFSSSFLFNTLRLHNLCFLSRKEKHREKCWLDNCCQLELPYKSRGCSGVLRSYLEKEG